MEPCGAVARSARGDINRLAPALHLPLGPLRKAAPTRWEGARTCNLAVGRADLDRVDGFDASFTGWGLEDSDLAIRLIHAGVRRKDGRFATGVLHLWHPANDRARLADNQARLDEVMRGDRVRALRGLSALGRCRPMPDSGPRSILRRLAAARPDALDRAVLALTRAMPANWLGLRLAILFRRIVMSRLGEGALDTMLWGMRLRLYPRRNGCEKNALFTPQMFDVMERGVLAEAIDARAKAAFHLRRYRRQCRALFAVRRVARAATRASWRSSRSPAFSIGCASISPPIRRAKVDVLPIALADRDGDGRARPRRERQRRHAYRQARRPRSDAGASASAVPCKPLVAVLAEAGIAAIDALKIDVEGAEDMVLAPFLRDAPRRLLPRLVLIEDTRGFWQTDLFALLERHGYTERGAQPPERGVPARATGLTMADAANASFIAAPSTARGSSALADWLAVARRGLAAVVDLGDAAS